MSQQAPNIVFILADNPGWADLSVYGQKDGVGPRRSPGNWLIELGTTNSVHP